MTPRPGVPREVDESPRTAAGRRRRSSQWMLLLTHAILLQATIFLIRPTISYRALELGIPKPWLGTLAASFTVVPLAIALVAGRLADRRGERLVLGIGAVLLVTGAAVFVLGGGGLGLLVVGSMLLGCGHLCSMLGEQSLVAGIGGGDMVGAFGHFALAQSLGQVVGPVAVAVMGGRSSQPETANLFLTGLLLAVVMGLVTTVLHSAPDVLRETMQDAGSLRAVLGVPGLSAAILTSLTVIASIDLLVVYLPVLGADHHLAASTVGGLLVVRALASTVSRFFLSSWARRLGKRNLLLASLVVATVAVAALPAWGQPWALAAVLVVAGLALGIGQPLTMAWVAEASPPQLRGTALSLRLSGNRLGQTVLPSVAGLCAAGLGTAGVFWAIAAALGATGLLTRRAEAGAASVVVGRD